LKISETFSCVFMSVFRVDCPYRDQPGQEYFDFQLQIQSFSLFHNLKTAGLPAGNLTSG